MKTLILFATLVFSTSSFAISTTLLIERCADKGVEKLLAQAQSKHCRGDEKQLSVREVDNRIMNPSKYVWYSMTVQCEAGKEELVEMVQYNSLTRECL